MNENEIPTLDTKDVPSWPTRKEQLPTFQIADANEWEDLLGKLWDDPFGHTILCFAATWANQMEAELAIGKSVSSCAVETACQIEKGMGGTLQDFVYGYAMEVLTKVWTHGPELANVYR